MSAAVVEVPHRRPQRRFISQAGYAAALAIVVAYLAIFFFWPLLGMIGQSLHQPGSDGLTVSVYQRIAASQVYLNVIIATLRISVEVTLVILLISYPIAMAMAALPGRLVSVLMVFVVVPYFTSTLVRTYAWIVLLGQSGVLNQVLEGSGITKSPIQFLYNESGVVIGLVYVFTPFMILVLYAVMRGIDTDYLRAAASSGAGPLRTFLRVYLPMSMPGVVAGSLLTFVMCIGSYLTPALMGSPKQTMIAMMIEQALNQLLNWGLGAGLAMVLLVIVASAYLIYDRLVGMARLFEATL